MPDTPSIANTGNTVLQGPTVFIDHNALRHNANLAKSLAPHTKLLAVIKANGYGHGAQHVAQSLTGIADSFGVARLEEAITLRQQQVKQPIIVMSPVLQDTHLEPYAEYQLTPVLSRATHFEALTARCITLGIPYWVKIDTGMHRLGLHSSLLADETRSADFDKGLRHAQLVMTHFKSAEADNRLDQHKQYKELAHIENFCAKHTIALSASNSANLLYAADDIHRQHLALENWIRPGIMLYGADPLETPNTHSKQLLPAMHFAAPIIDIKRLSAGESVGYNGLWTAQQDSLIATIAVGYADGYPRQLPNNTPVLINGQRAPLVGRVSMDMITVDITELQQSPVIGDAVTLWGESLGVNEIARYANTISYELFTGITPRVNKIHLNL